MPEQYDNTRLTLYFYLRNLTKINETFYLDFILLLYIKIYYNVHIRLLPANLCLV